MTSDRIILDYNNSLLKESDFKLLEGSNWLNDNLIGFWFEYLDNEVFHSESSLCFMSPEVTHFVKLASSEDAQSIVDSLNLGEKKCILMPINDSCSMTYDTHDSGSHWSLLVYSQTDMKWFHLDSLNGSNLKHAANVASKLNICHSTPVDLVCLQQKNGWDCGVFTCCHAELVANRAVTNGLLQSLPKLISSVPSTQRRKMIDVISLLASNCEIKKEKA